MAKSDQYQGSVGKAEDWEGIQREKVRSVMVEVAESKMEQITKLTVMN